MSYCPPVLEAAISKLPDEVYDPFMRHLNEGTSADYLSDWLRRMGTPVGATTIKKYRRTLRQKGVCK